MTVNTIASTAEFGTNGVTTNFPFYFKFLANADLVVTYVDPLGASSTLTLGTHYTVNGVGEDNGGSVVTTSALGGPGRLVVSREMDVYQQTSLRNQGKFLAETHEDVFDKLTMLIQQGLSTFKRALTRPLGREYFFAENRRIANVKDPVDAQDAATKKSVESYVGGLLQTGQGPVNSAANILYTNPSGVPAVLQALVGGMISGSLTVTVPGQFAEPADAMDWLRTKTIANGAVVTIKLTDGVITLTRGTSLNHPQNNLIELIGNIQNPAACQLVAAEGTVFDAFTCTSGCFRLINGFFLSRPNKAGTGFLALMGDIARVGPGVETNNFYYSYASRDGGRMQADDTVSRNAGDVGYWAYNGGSLGCKRAKAYDAIDVDSDLGYGFQAEYGGTLECEDAYATGCRKAGIAALAGGTVRAHNSNPSGNIGSGFLIRGASFIALNGATRNNNGRWGGERESNGVVSGNYVGAGNTLGQQKPVALLVNENGVSAVASNTGATLGIGSNGPEGVVITVQGATALRAGGAVNFLQADAALSGQPVLVKARGADNIIDIELSPKNGHVRLSGYSAHADAPITGCFEMMDTSGVIRRVAVIA